MSDDVNAPNGNGTAEAGPSTAAAPEPSPAEGGNGTRRIRRRGMRLATLRHARCAIAVEVRSLQRVPRDSLSVSERISLSRAIGGLVDILGGLIRASDLEQRVSRIEDSLRGERH